LTNREIIEKLRKRIADITERYKARSAEPDTAPWASDTAAPERYSAYPDVEPQVIKKDGFRIYKAAYSPGANVWLHPTSVEAILRLAGADIERLPSANGPLFLDIETTGLSGAGTVAFLIGLGKWDGQTFRITQFFLESRDSEQAMLSEMWPQIADAQVLVSFNGKCFDIPVLQARLTMNGMFHSLPELENKLHLDLYSVARKLGRHPFYGMSLQECTQRFLGIKRAGDIPGRMIPALYFMYERERDISVLDQVFRHNRLDILDMVVFLKYASHLFTQGHECCSDPYALAGIGRFYMAQGELELARRFLQAAADAAPLPHADGIYAHSRLLATVLRKQGKWQQAASIWQALIRGGHARYEDYLWLARYYEICLHDVETAFRIVLDCIEECKRLGKSIPKPVSSRKNRLSRIISNLHS
jgi:uncharacterized protein YprB with RNaseH-like and TPR domain